MKITPLEARKYGELVPGEQFVVRHAVDLTAWEFIQARSKHGICTVLPDLWAKNQYGRKVSFTDNYPVSLIST